MERGRGQRVCRLPPCHPPPAKSADGSFFTYGSRHTRRPRPGCIGGHRRARCEVRHCASRGVGIGVDDRASMLIERQGGLACSAQVKKEPSATTWSAVGDTEQNTPARPAARAPTTERGCQRVDFYVNAKALTPNQHMSNPAAIPQPPHRQLRAIRTRQALRRSLLKALQSLRC